MKRAPKDRPSAVVIIGAGAAGSACAEMLRREQYDGPVTLVDAEETSPYDRPNLSKDYLAGTAPEEWIPLHPPEFYSEHDITIVRSTVASLDANAREVRLSDGSTLSFGALLLAPGADPVRLELQLEKGARLLYLRSLADSRAIIAAAESSRRAVVLGASFIGLEVAASLRHRGLDVEVVAPEAIPLARVMGDELGGFVRRKHEANGVVFHLGTTARAIDRSGVTLADGRRIAADFVVAGVGVRPRVDLARAAGIPVDNGVPVDAFLRASAPGIYAAGDIARFPDPRTGENIRVEHWVVAQRQGQAAARNILGAAQPFDDVPFFWSHHYDAVIAYVGHASKWDRIALDGDPDALDCAATFWRDNQRLAVASIFRDRESLIAELELEREVQR